MKTPSIEWMKFVAAPSLGVQGLHARFNKHSYERHSHDYFVIGTIDVGAPKVALGNKVFVAPANTAMIINPGESHDGKPIDDAGYVYSMIYVEPWVIAEIAEEHGARLPSSTAFTMPVIADPDIVFGLRKLHRTLFLGQDSLEKESSLIGALTPLLQRFSSSVVSSSPLTYEPRIQRVRELIHERYWDQLTTADLAKAASLSRVRLNQLFTAAFGLPLHAYLNAVRLDVAKSLLRSGLSAAEVATSVGLSDQSHLIRRFRGTFGITPAQFTSAYLSDIQYSD
jgi:AraC-like DNA-binding protein